MIKINILQIALLAFANQAFADLPDPYVDLTGTYGNVKCDKGSEFIFPDLFGHFINHWKLPSFKLHVKQEIATGIENGKEYKIVLTESFMERDDTYVGDTKPTHFKSEIIHRTLYDERINGSPDGYYEMKNGSIRFKNRNVSIDKEWGYSRTVERSKDRYSFNKDGKLIIEGSYKRRTSGLILYFVPMFKRQSTSYRCELERI